MSLFKRRDKNASMIPPVAPPPAAAPPSSGGPPPSYSSPDPYASGPSDPSDPYTRRAQQVQAPLQYRSAQATNDPYGDAQAKSARSELLGGYEPDPRAAERKYGYAGREQEEDFDEDEEIEGIKQEMRGVKQESLASTRWGRSAP